VLFSIQDQQEAMRLIAYWQIVGPNPLKVLNHPYPATTYFSHTSPPLHNPNSIILQKFSKLVGKRVSFSIQDQQQAMTLISSMKKGTNLWSLTIYSLLWPQSRLLLFITFEILELYKNQNKQWKKIVLFSMQDQHQTMRFRSSWQIGPTKAPQPSISCYNLNPVYFWQLHTKF
jgi:hypothetical protein